MVVQLKQSLLSLHAISSASAAASGGTAAAAAGNPLDAVMSTNAVIQTKSLLEQLRQEEIALQQRLAEIDAMQQYQQVQASTYVKYAKCVAVLAYPGCMFCMVSTYILQNVYMCTALSSRMHCRVVELL